MASNALLLLCVVLPGYLLFMHAIATAPFFGVYPTTTDYMRSQGLLTAALVCSLVGLALIIALVLVNRYYRRRVRVLVTLLAIAAISNVFTITSATAAHVSGH